jgi:adenylylsulfate kinase
VEVLDGDEMRKRLSSDLGFTKDDRDANIRRIGFVARLLARHGVFVITAAISPYADTRNEMRRLAGDEEIPFVEVFVSATLQTLIDRDAKGLYKRALAGEILHFTGVSDPYEAPTDPDGIVHTDHEPVHASTQEVLALLVERGPHIGEAVPSRATSWPLAVEVVKSAVETREYRPAMASGVQLEAIGFKADLIGRIPG